MKKAAKWFQRAAAILLMVVLVLSMAGCAGASGKKNSSKQNGAQQTITSEASNQDTAKAKNDDTGKKQDSSQNKKGKNQNSGKKDAVSEDGTYSSKEEVAEYLYLYGHLPENYITKNEAKDLGWNSSEGNLWDVAPGKSIGGDRFGNREELLPDKKGRKYYECDIDFDGGYRNGKRIIYSNDGLIYYTEDHYQSFELLYGEE